VWSYSLAFGIATLVETGTYLGEMVAAQRTRFHRMWSIELSPELHRAAVQQFENARNVTLLQGDSGDLIEKVLADLEGPALFWLDAHYSEGNTARGSLETPVWRELQAILASPEEHVVLIDDARHFGTGDYPSIEAIRGLVESSRPGWTCNVATDIIRIHRPRRADNRLAVRLHESRH
jgi:hypothetical protein